MLCLFTNKLKHVPLAGQFGPSSEINNMHKQDPAGQIHHKTH
jgi:hypothetical protein